MMIYKNTSLVPQSNFVAVIDSYFYLFNTYSIKKHSYACIEVIFNWQIKVTWSDVPALIFGLFCFSGGLDLGTRISF